MENQVSEFGGANGPQLDSIEVWNEESHSWIMSNMKLTEAKMDFGYCQLPSY